MQLTELQKKDAQYRMSIRNLTASIKGARGELKIISENIENSEDRDELNKLILRYNEKLEYIKLYEKALETHRSAYHQFLLNNLKKA